MKFRADVPGRYTGRVVLWGASPSVWGQNATLSHPEPVSDVDAIVGGEVRVFEVQCTVRPTGHRARIEFVSPVDKPLVQVIISIVLCTRNTGCRNSTSTPVICEATVSLKY